MTALNLKYRVKNNRLNLSGLNLTEIPVKAIAAWKVTHLNLSNNKITSTDNVFLSLPDLVKLDLSSNRIKSVAEDIGSLQKLAYLSLANNKIKDLPKGMSKLKQLKHLSLNNNPLNSCLAKAVGFSQNNAQCKTAAANTVEFLKDNEGDSKKHVHFIVEKSKKKDKKIKAPPKYGLRNNKSKNKTEKKSGGFLSNIFEFLKLLSSCLIGIAALTTISIYALSCYDKKAYHNAIANILPMWTSVTSVLDPKVASKINYSLLQSGSFFDLAVQTCIESFTKSYKWIKANLIMQQ